MAFPNGWILNFKTHCLTHLLTQTLPDHTITRLEAKGRILWLQFCYDNNSSVACTFWQCVVCVYPLMLQLDGLLPQLTPGHYVPI